MPEWGLATSVFPMLRRTIRDHVTQWRRPLLRFFAREQDLAHEPPDAPNARRRRVAGGAGLGRGAIAGA